MRLLVWAILNHEIKKRWLQPNWMPVDVARWSKKPTENTRWLWHAPQGESLGGTLLSKLSAGKIISFSVRSRLVGNFDVTLKFDLKLCVFTAPVVTDIKLHDISRYISLFTYLLIMLISCHFFTTVRRCVLMLSRFFTVGLPVLTSNWTSLLPSSNVLETTLHLVSDLLNATCAQLDLNNADVHLRGQLTGTFDTVLVMLTMATSVAFGPGPGQATCHPMTSSLLTHQRSACNQTFCVIPAACRYIGYKAISPLPILWEYEFICVCDQAWCNELLLWLRPASVQGKLNRVQLCEVSVGFIWFVWHFPGHLFITPDYELFNYRSDIHTGLGHRCSHGSHWTERKFGLRQIQWWPQS